MTAISTLLVNDSEDTSVIASAPNGHYELRVVPCVNKDIDETENYYEIVNRKYDVVEARIQHHLPGALSTMISLDETLENVLNMPVAHFISNAKPQGNVSTVQA